MNELPELPVMFQRFAVALAIGLTIGIEREHEKSGRFAGVRTFTLIAAFGCVMALINTFYAPWSFVAALLVMAAVAVSSYRVTATADSPGITTEMSALLTFCYGAMTWWGLALPAAALAVVTVLLLHFKEPLQNISKRMGHHDLVAIIQFGVITLIILPLLPDRTFGPFAVLNPRKIWLMVVFIVALNLFGYVLIKLRGPRQGIGLAAFLGGLVSSTALTLGMSRRSKSEPSLAPLFGFGIMLACSIMFIRVLAIAYAVSPEVGRVLVYPMGTAGVAGLGGCLALWIIQKRHSEVAGSDHSIEIGNPCELGSAIRFGLLFGGILFVAKVAQVYVGTAGIYASSALSGLADVDAITLSLCSLAKGTISAEVAARGITLAAVCNTVIKMSIAASAGAVTLRRYTTPAFLVMTGVALVVAFILL